MNDSQWSESGWRSSVDALGARASTEAGRCLLGLLDESHPAFHGKSAGAVARMRGCALLTLVRFPEMADECLPLVLEELESGRDAYLIAVAATVLPQIAPPQMLFSNLLRRALAATLAHDERIDLACYGGLAESFDAPCASDLVSRALAWAETGAAPASRPESCAERSGSRPLVLDDALVEDQDGNRLSWRELVLGRPTLVVFFYTRCDNPDKCSSSIERVARVQAALRERGLANQIGTLSVTYDPSFDGPTRLRGYAASRGVQFGPAHRVIRVLDGHEQITRALGLGVNFASSLVNRHRIEAFVLDARGHAAVTYRRLKWSVDEVVCDLDRLACEPAAGDRDESPPVAAAVARGLPSALATSLAVALALFPKCPLCGAAYLSAAGLLAVPQMPGPYWAWPLLASGLVANVVSAAWMARRSGSRAGFWVCAAGAAVVISAHAVVDVSTPLVWSGIAIMAAGSLLSVVARSPKTPPPGTAAFK